MNQQTVSHDLRREKRMSTNFRRRCWTEICRKVDGEREKERKPKTQEDNSPYILLHPYTSTCFELFLFVDRK